VWFVLLYFLCFVKIFECCCVVAKLFFGVYPFFIFVIEVNAYITAHLVVKLNNA